MFDDLIRELKKLKAGVFISVPISINDTGTLTENIYGLNGPMLDSGKDAVLATGAPEKSL